MRHNENNKNSNDMEEQILNTVAKYTTGRKNCEELTKELLSLLDVSFSEADECVHDYKHVHIHSLKKHKTMSKEQDIKDKDKALHIGVVMPSSYIPYDLDLPNGLYKIFTDRNREGVAEMFYGHWMEHNFSPLPDEKIVGFKPYYC